MDETLAQWLALREPIDAAARSTRLTRAIADVVAGADPVNVLDLATGAGSNLRYLIDRLPPRQRWLAVDHSPTLLAHVPAGTASWGKARGYEVVQDSGGCTLTGERLDCRVETRRLDLGGFEQAEIFAGRHLVTASALLDLVSEDWLRSLAQQCRKVGAAVLFTITYNGFSSCSPVDPEDDRILGHFNRHQHTDKGLGGPAAGPDAADCAVRCFAEAGYRVQSEPSDWNLGLGERELQRQLIDGWADAAAQIVPEDAAIIARWRDRRMEHLESGRSHVIVGHHDLAAWLDHA
jgi:hypothetical protein